MKNRLHLIAIYAVFLIPFVAPWEGASSAKGWFATKGVEFNQAVTPVSGVTVSFMPVLDWDMSDLDVRDAQNHPVRNAQATQDITRLFLGNLFQLVVISDLRVIEQIWADAALFSRL